MGSWLEKLWHFLWVKWRYFDIFLLVLNFSNFSGLLPFGSIFNGFKFVQQHLLLSQENFLTTFHSVCKVQNKRWHLLHFCRSYVIHLFCNFSRINIFLIRSQRRLCILSSGFISWYRKECFINNLLII